MPKRGKIDQPKTGDSPGDIVIQLKYAERYTGKTLHTVEYGYDRWRRTCKFLGFDHRVSRHRYCDVWLQYNPELWEHGMETRAMKIPELEGYEWG